MDLILRNFLENVPTIGLVLVIGLSIYILGKGADYFVDQAIILSMLWKIPTVIVGATIVSLGTTIPEVTVSLLATLKGNTDIALGNAVGSIITNTSLILGLSAYIGVIPVNRKIMKNQGLGLLILTILVTGLSLPIFHGGGLGKITRGLGFLLLVILGVYIVKSIKDSKGTSDIGVEEDVDGKPVFLQIIKLMLGAVVVVFASKFLIPSVEIIAFRVGIPDSIIAATLVAFGTSVPELITAITAMRKGHGELALGNIIGANILNILFVIGLSASVSKTGLTIPRIYSSLQMPLMIISTAVLYGLAMNKEGEMKRKSGLVLLSMYLVYLVLNYLL